MRLCLQSTASTLPPLPPQTPKEVDSEQVGRAAFDPMYGLDDDLDPEVGQDTHLLCVQVGSLADQALGCRLQMFADLQANVRHVQAQVQLTGGIRTGICVMPAAALLTNCSSPMQDIGLRRNEVHDATPSVIESRLRQVRTLRGRSRREGGA